MEPDNKAVLTGIPICRLWYSKTRLANRASDERKIYQLTNEDRELWHRYRVNISYRVLGQTDERDRVWRSETGYRLDSASCISHCSTAVVIRKDKEIMLMQVQLFVVDLEATSSINRQKIVLRPKKPLR